MAKRKTTDSEVGGAPATRRSTRLKTTTKEEPILEEKPVKATKAKATKATVKASPVQDEQTEGDEKKVKVCVILISSSLCFLGFGFHGDQLISRFN